ncbi:MAG: hypothetical protein HXY21_09390 [Parvularculaceae bacterium]|nr:hypothetical protein [Parvularculaceae bacterium]
MRAEILAMALVMLAAEGRSAQAQPKSAEERVEQAREALRRRLMDAHSEGLISIKGEAPADGASSSTSDQPSATRTLSPPPLREAAGSAVCVTPSWLKTVAAALGERPADAIEALRRQGEGFAAVGVDDANTRLSAAYLVIGFAEEARAAAAGDKGAAASAISGLAELMIGNIPSAAEIGAACGPVSRMLRRAKNLIVGAKPAPDEQDLRLLAAFPAPIASAIAETLTPHAIAQGEDEIVSSLREILKATASASRASALIDFARADAKGVAEETAHTVALIASESGPLQAQALQALAAKGADYAAFEDDLEDAALAAPERARAQIELVIAERRLKQDDIQRALKALSRALRADPAIESKARAIAGEALDKRLLSGERDKIFAALAALASEPHLAAPAISAPAAAIARDALVRLGAAADVDTFLRVRGADQAERDLAVALAHLSLGRTADVLEVTNRHPSDPRFDELRAKLRAFAAVREFAVEQDLSPPTPASESKGFEASQVPSSGPPPAHADATDAIRFTKSVAAEIVQIRKGLSQ